MKNILLTFDLEEFDLPKEFRQQISNEETYSIAKEGLNNLLNLIDKRYKVSATFFTTANFAKQFPSTLRKLAINHEIACHGYNHSDNYKKDISKLRQAKEEIEDIINKEVKGFRAPRFQIQNISSLSSLGFSYDSSIHPTFIPGRYVNLNQNRKIHRIGNTIEIPLSVYPIVRFPLFWMAFKNLPLIYSKLGTRLNFLSSNYNMVLFHPWEFADLSNIKIPNYIKSKDGLDLINKFNMYLQFCKMNKYNFKTISNFLDI